MVDSFYTAYAKKEATYGVDAVPTGPLNAILTRNFRATPIEIDFLERNLDLATRGKTRGVPSNERQLINYEVELQGSGAAGTAAAWMELLEGCGGAAPVLTASTKAEQKFAALGAALSGLTHYWYTGTQRRRSYGARGDITAINFTAGAYPFLGLSYIGLLPTGTPVDEVAMGAAADYTRWKTPLEVNTANTDFLLDGYAAPLRSFVAQANVDLKLRNLVGANYVQRGNHGMSVKIVIEEPNYAAKNYFAQLRAGSVCTTQIVHGTVAGSIVQLDASFLQIAKIEETKEDDIAMLEIDAFLTVSAGQDDILFTAK